MIKYNFDGKWNFYYTPENYEGEKFIAKTFTKQLNLTSNRDKAIAQQAVLDFLISLDSNTVEGVFKQYEFDLEPEFYDKAHKQWREENEY